MCGQQTFNKKPMCGADATATIKRSEFGMTEGLALNNPADEIMLTILDRDPGIGRLVRNEWVRLALLDPETQAIRVYRDGAFHDYQPEADQLPQAPSSVDWYRGWRDHLGFALLE